MRRMVQAAFGVTLHMPEATSALRSVHTKPLNFDIMLPLPGAGFELAVTWPASGWSLALYRGPILLFRVLRFGHSVLPEHRPVCRLLEFASEQEGMQRHLVLRDADDAELVEEPLPLVAELLDEQVVRGPSSERRPRIAVQVRHDQVDLLLAERVERDAFLENAPQVQVEALDVGLLA